VSEKYRVIKSDDINLYAVGLLNTAAYHLKSAIKQLCEKDWIGENCISQ